MAKKKPQEAASTEPAEVLHTIDLSLKLTLDDEGYGALPNVVYHPYSRTISPNEIGQTLEILRAQGLESAAVYLRDSAKAGQCKQALQELTSSESCASWTPVAPAGDGWVLIAVLFVVCNHSSEPIDSDAVALFARA